MRRIVVAVLLLCSFAFGNGRSGSHSSSHSYSSSSHSHRSKSSAPKTVHVREYTRKDGTVVHAHDRRAPGTASVFSVTTGSSSRNLTPYRHNYAAEGYTLHPTVQRDKHGKIKRSKAAKAAFEREHPCPSTGKTSGRCPGYVVDHVRALECGGPDDPSNMQWQTVADGKAKDETERYCGI